MNNFSTCYDATMKTLMLIYIAEQLIKVKTKKTPPKDKQSSDNKQKKKSLHLNADSNFLTSI